MDLITQQHVLWVVGAIALVLIYLVVNDWVGRRRGRDHKRDDGDDGRRPAGSDEI